MKKKGRSVTIIDIAAMLGLSPSTVSRGINGSSLIRDEVRERVIAAAKQMGYEKRQIRRHGTRAILNINLFFPTDDRDIYHLSVDEVELIKGITSGFGETKVNVIPIVSKDYMNIFHRKKIGEISACIFSFIKPDISVESFCVNRNIPIVIINKIDNFHSFVTCDHCGGIKTLLKELVSRSTVPIRSVFLTLNTKDSIAKERERGYIEGCIENNISIRRRDIVVLNSLSEINDDLFESFFNRGYNSVVCCNDIIAVAFYQAALHRGISIPRDFKLTGFDNSPINKLLYKKIDTIDIELYNLGFEAGNWLKRVIIEKSSEPLQLVRPIKYIRGDTIG